jgi:hypothetical protein
MNDVYNGEVGVRRANALARLTPLILGTMEQETKRMEMERHDAWVAAEAERLAAYREMAAERRRQESTSRAQAAAEPHVRVADPGISTPTAATWAQQGRAAGARYARQAAELRADIAKDSSMSTRAAQEPQVEVTGPNISATTAAASKLQTSTAGDTSTPAPAISQPLANTAGDGCATRATKPAAVTITDKAGREERRTREDDHLREGESFRQFQDRLLAKLDQERRQSEQQTGVPHSRPSASGNNHPQSLPDKDAHPASPSASDHSKPNSFPPLPKNYQSTVPTRASREWGTQATHPSQKAREGGPPPGPQLDYDNQPSPIPGLQNRHLNYQKYMGAPVSYLKRLGFVFPRRRWQLW